MSKERFQVIVIGAGPAGSAAAYSLAKKGHQVLIVERGKKPGSKNVSGGRIYTYALEKLMPGKWDTAPFEREITQETIMMMSENRAVSLKSINESSGNSYSVLRSKFDPWLAQQAEYAGATLVSGATVNQIIVENGKVCGVMVDSEQLYADIVICADGANSLLAAQAGLKTNVLAKTMALGVKMVISLTDSIINERFNTINDQGMACLMVGDCTKGIPGGGFLYTNKESLSLGLVIDSLALKNSNQSVVTLMEDFMNHPVIAPLILGGKHLEYSAHLVPESGIQMLPDIYADGLLLVGDAAGLVVNCGFTVRGMDYAILSGIAAAKTVDLALSQQDFSQKILRNYETLLRDDVIKDMATFNNTHRFMQNTPNLYKAYPALINDVFQNIFWVDGKPAKKISTIVKDCVKRHTSLWQLTKDFLKGAFSL